MTFCLVGICGSGFIRTYPSSRIPTAVPHFPQIWPLPAQVLQCKGAPIYPYAAYQGAKALCIHPIWMWDAVWSCLQPHPWHYSVIGVHLYPIFPRIGPHLHRCYSVRLHPYAHPQHIKVLKHLVYNQYGCGMQSEAVFSLKHDTTASFGFSHTPFSPNFSPTCTRKGVTICPFKAYQGAKTLCIHPIWMWDAVWSCFQPQPWHHSIIHVQSYPIFLNSGPHLHKCYSVRVHPYGPSQHIKVLKHFVYIQ